MVFVAVSDVYHEESIEEPGAKMSTHAPMFEKPALRTGSRKGLKTSTAGVPNGARQEGTETALGEPNYSRFSGARKFRAERKTGPTRAGPVTSILRESRRLAAARSIR